jgi:K319-like protein
MGTIGLCLDQKLKDCSKNKNLTLLIMGASSIMLLLLIPTSTVFAQVSLQNPWALFQTLCPQGRLATGPQCTNLFTGTNTATCDNSYLVAIGVCTPSSNTGTCPANYQLQNGVCVPISTTCPSGTVLQNGVCVPTNITCPIGSILQNGVCVPFTNPGQSAPVANAGTSQTATSGTTVFLDGSGSFATTNGATIVSYSWVQSPGSTPVTLTGANTATPSFVAPIVVNQTPLVFSLTVTDSLGQVSTPSSVTVTVFPS